MNYAYDTNGRIVAMSSGTILDASGNEVPSVEGPDGIDTSRYVVQDGELMELPVTNGG